MSAFGKLFSASNFSQGTHIDRRSAVLQVFPRRAKSQIGRYFSAVTHDPVMRCYSVIFLVFFFVFFCVWFFFSCLGPIITVLLYIHESSSTCGEITGAQSHHPWRMKPSMWRIQSALLYCIKIYCIPSIATVEHPALNTCSTFNKTGNHGSCCSSWIRI